MGAAPDGDPAVAISLPVEAGSASDGLGILFFQGLRRLEIRSTVTKRAELMLPWLTALAVYGVQMEDLTPLRHALSARGPVLYPRGQPLPPGPDPAT